MALLYTAQKIAMSATAVERRKTVIKEKIFSTGTATAKKLQFRAKDRQVFGGIEATLDYWIAS